MKLYIVRTGDGPVYFRGTKPGKRAAMMLAKDMVLQADSGRYEQEDRDKVNVAFASRYSEGKLWEALIDCYALEEAKTQN